jgi:hypothetical protein
MKPILVLTIREHGCEDDIYVFSNRDVNILPTIKEWCIENDMELEIPDDLKPDDFMDWFRSLDHQYIFINTHLKQLLDE